MRDLNGRAILADEVGLGKTIEAGIVVKEYLLRGAVRTVLVLVPASLCEQWRAELWEKFELDFVVSRGPAGQWGRHPLVISSLETARHERHRRRVRGANYDLLVVDEAHRLRNHLTLGWKFVNDLNPRYLLLVTATPVQNDMRELYNLTTLVRPGTVGTFVQFRRDFLSGHDKRSPRNTPRLRSLLETVMIRTRRSDTDLTFAPRKVETLWVSQTPAERKLYREISEFVAAAVHGEAGRPGRPHYFTLMVLQKEMGSSWAAARATLERLSQNPDGLDPRSLKQLAACAAEVGGMQSKLRSLLRFIASLNGEKCIVFTQFRSTQDTIVDALREMRIEPAVFHGELGWREKEEALDRFRTALPVLVSTEAGGEGRNLQYCRIIANYDLPWNPMRLEQRIGRVHRLGQAHPVRVVNMAARGTIEAYVLEILDRKIRMFELVVGEMEEILGTWQPHGSFEDEVFKRWTESTNPRVRKRRFAELAQHLMVARRLYQQQKERQDWLFPSGADGEEEGSDRDRGGATAQATRAGEEVARRGGRTRGAGGCTPCCPEWRAFVGHWLEIVGVRGARRRARATGRSSCRRTCSVAGGASACAWSSTRSAPTLPRGAWFTAPGSSAGRKILEVALESPIVRAAHRPRPRPRRARERDRVGVPRARPVVGPARLGPVRYERRVAFHAVVTRWGGLPWQEPWVVLLGPGGEFVEWACDSELPDVRVREGLYQINDDLTADERAEWMTHARRQLDRLLGEREEEWARTVARLRDDELDRLGAFFSSRIEEEEERLRRRTGNGDEAEIEHGDATSLKLEWERRAAEVRQRWALRTSIRLWGLVEWSWPVADLEQELRAGAMHVRLTSRVDVARGQPALPHCPHCGAEAEMLVRSHGSVGCPRCA